MVGIRIAAWSTFPLGGVMVRPGWFRLSEPQAIRDVIAAGMLDHRARGSFFCLCAFSTEAQNIDPETEDLRKDGLTS
jgi:hypothetical protein